MRKKILIATFYISMIMLAGCGAKEKEENRDSVKDNIKVEDTKKNDTEEKDSEEKDTEEEKTEEKKEEKDTEVITSEEREINLEAVIEEGKPAYEKYYDEIITLDEAESFVGEWNRTDIHSSYEGFIMIENQDEEGFDFEGGFCYYSHSGDIAGKAYYLSKNTAICKFDEYGETEYIMFQLKDGRLVVSATAGSSTLGLGMNVSVDGEYITGEPFYTNATILEDTFKQEDLDSLKSTLGEEVYEDCFAWVVRTGILTETECVLEDGTQAKFYEAFVPTMGGYEFELLIVEDGRWYFLSEAYRYNTNVADELDFPNYTVKEE